MEQRKKRKRTIIIMIAVFLVLAAVGSGIVYFRCLYYPDRLSEAVSEKMSGDWQYINISLEYKGEKRDYFISRDNEICDEIQNILKDTSVKETKVKKYANFDDKEEKEDYWCVGFETGDWDWSVGKVRNEKKKLRINEGTEFEHYSYKENLDKKLWECITKNEREFTWEDLKELCKKETITGKDFDLCRNVVYEGCMRVEFENGWYMHVIMQEGVYSPDTEPEQILLFKSGNEYMDIRDKNIMEFIHEAE